MTAAPPLMEAVDLALGYDTPGGEVRALDGATLAVAAGETVGLVGESGSGKTTLGMAAGRLLPSNARRIEGDLRLDGASVFEAGDEALRRLRREKLGFVFQNPMTALDPTMKVGRQLARALARKPAPGEIERLFARVGLPEPERVAESHPHELSGGMAQRVVIAMAIARGPALLIADEPTASLDASVRNQILELLLEMRRATGASLLILSHDLRMIARHCDRVAIMYGGRIVEAGPSAPVFDRPRHPYTRALIAAAAGNEGPDGRLEPIPGAPPVLTGRAAGCAYAPRCPLAVDACRTARPAPALRDGREILCHRVDEIDAGTSAAATEAGR